MYLLFFKARHYKGAETHVNLAFALTGVLPVWLNYEITSVITLVKSLSQSLCRWPISANRVNNNHKRKKGQAQTKKLCSGFEEGKDAAEA